jgi:hypothetical protein
MALEEAEFWQKLLGPLPEEERVRYPLQFELV